MPYIIVVNNDKAARIIVQKHFGKDVDYAVKITEIQKDQIRSLIDEQS